MNESSQSGKTNLTDTLDAALIAGRDVNDVAEALMLSVEQTGDAEAITAAEQTIGDWFVNQARQARSMLSFDEVAADVRACCTPEIADAILARPACA